MKAPLLIRSLLLFSFLIGSAFISCSNATPKPYVLWPKKGQVLSPKEIPFEWGIDTVVTEFQFQVSKNSSFSNIIHNANSLTKNRDTLRNLGEGRYYWRVRGNIGGSFSSWSDTGFFRALSPASIPKLHFWFLPDSGVVTSGSSIVEWKDQSGNGNHLTQNQSANAPDFISKLPSINGHGSSDLDGTDDYLESSDFGDLMEQGNSILFVGKLDSNIGNGSQWMDGNGSSGRHIVTNDNLDDVRIWAGSGINFTNATSSRAFNIVSAIYNNNNSKIVINAKDSVQGNAGSNVLSGITVGSRYQNSTNFFAGKITE
ncbi:MAG: hypothetical protein ABEH38_00005, partial [Flavobacteriales bacterium]